MQDPYINEFPTIEELENDAKLLYKSVTGVEPEYDIYTDEHLTQEELKAFFNIN